MRRGTRLLALFLALVGPAPPLIAQGGGTPRLLHAHPDRDLPADAGPYWVAASDVFKSDDTVEEAWRIGEQRAASIALQATRNAKAEDNGDAPDCQVSPKQASARRALIDMPARSVFLPGDFTGWVAASEAVVLGTATELVPGFDAAGRSNTLVVLGTVDHLFPPREYPHLVKYVILPYARFVAGGTVFCRPWSESQEYYPAVGDRLLIAADSPADNKSMALTVRAMSRVVQVQDNDTLVTYGRPDFYPVAFSPDFPETLDEAKARTWRIWRNGLVDLAASLGLEEFTQIWRGLRKERSEMASRGCDVDQGQLHNDVTGWSFSVRCPSPAKDLAGDDPEKRSR